MRFGRSAIPAARVQKTCVATCCYRHHSSLGIDVRMAAKAPKHFGILVKHFDRLLKKRRQVNIVVGDPLEIFGLRQLEDPIVIPSTPQIFFFAIITNAVILLRIALTNILRAILRTVVGDDQFEIAIRLTQHRFDRLSQIALTVVNRQSNADAWFELCHGRLGISV